MDKSILLQKQVKDNTEDLQKEFLDMKNWEEQMKRKDEELRKEESGQITLPPVRSRHQNKAKNAPTKHNGIDTKSKRIKSYDYSAWDKFDVDSACKDVDKEEQSDDSGDETMSKEELEKAHQVATKHKNEGNALVQQQKWSKAISCYNQAIKAFPYDAVFYANRALCQLKLDNFHSAESDCSAAIQLDETYVKAYHRRATARMNLKQYKEAKQDLEKVLKLESSNKEAKSLLVQIENKIKVSEPSILNKSTKKLPEESIEKIDKKICVSTVSETQSSKSTKDSKRTNDNETKIKNIKDSICGISTANNKNDTVDDAIKKQERDPRIPDWLPEKNDVIVIEPTKKPPHLRSKKSLTRISVEEVEFDTLRHKYEKDKIESKKSELVLQKDVSKDNNLMESNGPAKSPKITEDICNIPPVPKTAVQFMMNWATIKSSEFRYKYLKQLPENNLPLIFQDSMESNIFSDILEVLKTEFIKREEPVYCYLKDLSQVKRFRTLILFLSDSDIKDLRILFEYCKTVEHISQEELKTLQDRYELTVFNV